MGVSLGERLKELVKEKGLEQQEVAFLLKIKSATFNGYISNKREPANEKLKQFAEFFGVSIDYLIGYSDIKNPYLKHLPHEINAFVREQENIAYLELALDIKEKTIFVGKKRISK